MKWGQKGCKGNKAKSRDPGPSQQGIECQQLWTGGLLSCWVSKATKNTLNSMRPILAAASGLSPAFPLLQQTMQPGPENNGSFPAQLYFTGPSILCRAEISSCGRGMGGRETEGGEQRLALADQLTRSGRGSRAYFG